MQNHNNRKNEYNAINDGIRDDGNKRGRGEEDARHCASKETTTAINKFEPESKKHYVGNPSIDYFQL